jgi:hypothetical protein
MSKGLTRAGFDADLRIGHQAEGEFLRQLHSGPLEHKADKKARETGNIFVEYAQPSGKSGLATTKAETWVFEVNDGVWIAVSTDKLKEIARKAHRCQGSVNGGDYNNYTGVLVNIVKHLVKQQF